MISSWIFISFHLDVPNELSISVDPSMLGHGRERTIYYADHGRNSYRLIIIHAKGFDPEEVIRSVQAAAHAKRRLIVLFHKRHFETLNKSLSTSADLSLIVTANENSSDSTFVQKLLEDVSSSASETIESKHVKIDTIYTAVSTSTIQANSSNSMENSKMEELVNKRWRFSYTTTEGQIRSPFRDMMTHSYFLETDRDGNRLGVVYLKPLQDRVVALDNEFRSWLSELETDSIFRAEPQGVIEDAAFPAIKDLLEAAFSPHDALVADYTPHEILNMIYDGPRSFAAAKIAELLSESLKHTLGISAQFMSDSIFEMHCSKPQWTLWVEVLTNPGMILRQERLSNSDEILINTQAVGDRFYLLCGPSFGLTLSLKAKKRKPLYILWALSVVNLIKGMKTLAEQFPPEVLRIAFPHFFDEVIDPHGNAIHYTLSTREGFARMKASATKR